MEVQVGVDDLRVANWKRQLNLQHTKLFLTNFNEDFVIASHFSSQDDDFGGPQLCFGGAPPEPKYLRVVD